MKITHVKGKLLNGLEVDISLTAPNGQPVRRFVIAGDNGAGKTILLRSMKYENDDIEVTSIETKDSSYYINMSRSDVSGPKKTTDMPSSLNCWTDRYHIESALHLLIIG